MADRIRMRWHEIDVRLPGNRPMRELLRAPSGTEAKRLAARRYGPAAEVTLIRGTDRRLTRPQRLTGRRSAVVPQLPEQPSTRLRGATAFENLQATF